MAQKAVSFSHKDQGTALIDAHTPLHALLGFAAGVLAVDAHVAFGILLGARIVAESMSTSPKRALFTAAHKQTLGNELADLAFEIAGLHYGEKLRARLSEQQPVSGPPLLNGIR